MTKEEIKQLIQYNFSTDEIEKAQKSPKILQGLKELLTVVCDTSGLKLLDDNGHPITQLAQIIQAGFTQKAIVSVLSHGGGSTNLAALKELLTVVVCDTSGLDTSAFKLLDGNGHPITQLAQIIQAGFTQKAIVSVLSHGGGSKNLAALKELLTVVCDTSGLDTSGLKLLDDNRHPITQLAQIIQAGFTPKAIVSVLSNNGGSKNLAALKGLLTVACDTSGIKLLDGHGNPITQLAQIIQAGFTPEAIVSVLSHDGGSKNLAALKKLLTWNPITQLAQIIQAGFTSEAIVSVLSNNGGSKNLAALKELLTVACDTDGLELLDDNGHPITQLAQIIQAGFTPETIVSVLSHGGGSKNLAALKGLLTVACNTRGFKLLDGHGNPITQLVQIIQTGFTPEVIVSVLSHDGGSKNLAALKELLTVGCDTSAPKLLDDNGYPITQLAQIIQAGFTPKAIVSVLSHDGGSKNLAALKELLTVGCDTSGLDTSALKLLDDNGHPITQLTQIIQADFTPETIVSVLSHGGGSKNLAALKGLLTVACDTRGFKLLDDNGHPITQLAQIIQAGFTPEAIVSVLSHDGGSKNLAALKELFTTSGIELLDDNGHPITQLAQIIQAGFTPKAIVSVLSNNGGSKNLAALKGLLTVACDIRGLELLDGDWNLITQLAQIIQAGFTPEAIVSVLSHDGGSKNLAALKELFTVGCDTSGIELLDDNGHPITQLAQIIQAGFTPEAIVSVLSHGGGSKNLAALKKLLSVACDTSALELLYGYWNSITQLAQIIQAGFTLEAIVSVLSHGGGSKNLAALKELLTAVCNADGTVLLDSDRQAITRLSHLHNFNISNDDIIEILSKLSGSNSLCALVEILIVHPAVFTTSKDHVVSLLVLAKTKAKASIIAFLSTCLSHSSACDLFKKTPRLFINFLKRCGAKERAKLSPEKITEASLQGSHRKRKDKCYSGNQSNTPKKQKKTLANSPSVSSPNSGETGGRVSSNPSLFGKSLSTASSNPPNLSLARNAQQFQ